MLRTHKHAFAHMQSAISIFLFIPICFAESISGRVYDPAGRLVAGARVMLMQDYVKLKETKSDDLGEFVFSGLQEGMYQVQIKQPRFSLFQQSVQLGNQPMRIYAVLPLARETEAVEIDAPTTLSREKPGEPIGHSVTLGGQVEPAELIQPIRPAYPRGASTRGAQGSVVLYATIQTDGTVSDPVVLEPVDPDLEREALRSAGTLRYRPMRLNGAPVACQVTIVLDFKLQ